MAYDYSSSSAAGRDVALALLDGSRKVEGLEVPAASRDVWVPALFLIRARRLIRSALVLADAGHGIEASIVLRAVVEYLITLQWLFLDFDAHDLVWRIDDLRSILAMDDAATGAGFAVLNPEIRPLYEEAKQEWRTRLDALEGVDERVPEQNRERLPSFEMRARAVQLEGLYGLAYRWDSLAAAHPNATAVEQFLERPGDGVFRVASEPQHPLPDPYPIAALLLMLVLLKTGDLAEELRFDGDLHDVAAHLRELDAMTALELRPVDDAPSVD
jgi:Family of unknown function (DUF5677)